MKKTALTAIIILFFLSALRVKAQEFNFAKAYQDYIYTQTVYDQAYSDYEEAKDFYLKNSTLTLKEEARKKTLIMLKARDELFRVYLTALRLKIVELKSLSQDEKNGIFSKIDGEVNWYKEHKDSYKGSDTLEDLFNKSKEAENRFKTNTTQVSYESLFTTSLGEVVGIRMDHEDVYKNLKSMVSDPTPLNRWFTDIENVISTLKQNEDKAKSQIQKLYSQGQSAKSVYSASITILSSSIPSLSQLNKFLTELLTSIKNQP